MIADPRDHADDVHAPSAIAAGIAEAARRIGAASDVLLASHRRPDGDGTGSMAALALLLRARGKRATIFAPDLIPRRYKWLPAAKTAVQRLPADARFDATIVVDCADPKLLGDSMPPEPQRGALITLDHHASGRPFGEVAICDPSAAACAVLVARIAHQLGWDIRRCAARAPAGLPAGRAGCGSAAAAVMRRSPPRAGRARRARPTSRDRGGCRR